MKQLKEILYKAGLTEVIGSTAVEVNGITFNSKDVES